MIITLSLSLMLLAAIPEPSSFWPTTIVGWITTAGFLASIGLFFIDRGKREQKINDWGERVNVWGEDVKRLEGTMGEHEKLMVGIVTTQERITLELGKATTKAEDSEATSERHAIELGVKVDEMRRSLEQKLGTFGERMAGVERELELGRQDRFNSQLRRPSP